MSFGVLATRIAASVSISAFVSIGLFGTSACQHKRNVSDVMVTNGRVETGFPYVVQIKIDERGWCSGTFVSDSLLLTAAHCVHRAQKISFGNVSSDRSNFFIHPKWPSGGAACSEVRLPRYDLALVKFPAQTFVGPQVASLVESTPVADDKLTIVGYGNSEITPFQKFCRLPETERLDGQCSVELGQRNSVSEMEFSSLYSFSPTADSVAGQAGCPVECPTASLRVALEADATNYADFVASKCDGNFRDRHYRETGLGTKRSGENKILKVEEGTIKFSGVIAGLGDGIDSASGAGDSGGPLFVEKDGKLLQAGVTHGGSVTMVDGKYQKHSIYVDLFDSENRTWLKEISVSNDLKFPQFR